MRQRTTFILLALSLIQALTLSAADRARVQRARAEFVTVSRSEAARELPAGSVINTSLAMWTWSDKQVYMPGQNLTIRWTVRPNGDIYPYTVVAYIQNNQTGAKTYLPGGASATDIFGNTPDDGFLITRPPVAEKAVLAGAGGMFPAVAIPNQPGMHTVVVQLRDYTGNRIVKAAYWKFNVVTGIETLPSTITTDRTLTNDTQWNLLGAVIVKDGATLTIEPGTVIIGQPGSQPPSVLIIGNTGRLMAVGTRSRPIIFTSSQPYGQRRAGDWGGVVLLGKAPTNWPQGVGNIEGLPPDPSTEYGGDDPEHDCGTMRYVRLEFSGAELRPNDEINSFTWGGCGTQTHSSFLQAHYGLDDSFEWFAGNNDLMYALSTYPRDDHFDGQIGWSGRVQFGVALGNLNNTNRGIEMDNNENNFGALPRSTPTFYNMTFVGVGDSFSEGVDEGSVAGIYLRRGAAGHYNNFVIQNWVDRAIEFQHDETLANGATGDLSLNGMLWWMNGVASGAPNTLAGQVSENGVPLVNTQSNIMVADPMLRRPFEYGDPDFRPQVGSPVFRANWVQPPDDGFFNQFAPYSGAFGDVNWLEEWSMPTQEEDLAP